MRVNMGGAKYRQEPYTTRQRVLDQLKDALEPERTMSAEEKSDFENKLNRKIQTGEKLTQGEMYYIRRTNPAMYARILRVQMQRDMLERKLKNCKSKKEVETVYAQTIGTISKKDPDKQALLCAYDNVTRQFKKTMEYKSLPDTKKEEDEQLYSLRGYQHMPW